MLNLETKSIEIKLMPTSIDLKNEKDAENYLKEYYINRGYSVFKTIDLRKKLQQNILSLSFCFENIKNILLFEDLCGLPDLTIFNERELFFVEVKTTEGSLASSQLHWLLYHTNEKIIIYLIKCKIDNYDPVTLDDILYKRKCRTEEIKQQKIKNLQPHIDYIYKFLNLILDITKHKDDYVTKRKLYLIYTKYCVDNNFIPLSEIIFGREISNIAGITSKRVTNKILSDMKGKQVQEECWVGIRVRNISAASSINI